MAAERLALVVAAEYAAVLEDRHELVDDAAEVGRVVDADVEAVAGSGLPPLDELVRDGLDGADELALAELAGGFNGLAQRPAVVGGALRDPLRLGVERAFAELERLGRERCVEVVLGEVVPPERPAELPQRRLEAVVALVV